MTNDPADRLTRVGDKIIVGGEEFEVRLVITEDGNLVLADFTGELWVLSQPKLVWLYEHTWRAGEYASFEKAGE